jgi:hypothetical protein
MPENSQSNHILWTKILSNDGMFENVKPFPNYSSNQKELYPLGAYAFIIALAILIIVGIHENYGIWRIIIIFWGIAVFPVIEIKYRDRLKSPVTSCLCAIHMGVFIEVSYFSQIWIYEGKIVFTTVVSMLRLFLGGDAIFPITMCTSSVLQCWAHGESKLIPILFTYFFLLLIFFFNRIMRRLRLR